MGASVAVAVPAAGTVEVRDEIGNLIDTTSGADAVHDALLVVTTRRLGDAAPWSIAIGAGTHGDFAVAQRNLTIAGDPAAAAVISGPGVSDDTTGGCVTITRGNVTLTGVTCRGGTKSAVAVTLVNADGGVVVRDLTAIEPGADGVTATGGQGIVIENLVATNPKRSGIRLASLTGAGPYAVVGGSVTGASANGLHLAADVSKLSVTGLAIAASRGAGVLCDSAGNADITLQTVTASGGAKDGISLKGGGLRIAVRDSVVSRNAGAGIRLADGTGLRVSGVTLDGTNRGGDLLFTADERTGGTYTALQAGGGFALVGEPYATRISAATAGIPESSGGRARTGAALSLAATAFVPRRVVVVRWDGGGPIWRGAGTWTRVETAKRIRGSWTAVVNTKYLGTTAARYAAF